LKKISTWHIHLEGQVQGVGFRPFVYQLAKKLKINGWVNNSVDGVHIEFNAQEALAKIFYQRIFSDAPELSKIISHRFKESPAIIYDEFTISSSNNEGYPVLLISPDFGMCKGCCEEIADEKNRRFRYAFTTCTQCGPRFSIIRQLPYDRENTAMDVFPMCSRCDAEYNDPMNRRHFSQTNSCPDCAVSMKLIDSKQNIIEADQAEIISQICEFWNNGKIVAIKGIGGYLLTCDASNRNTIQQLRIRKHRPRKPFALMSSGISLLQKEVHITDSEKTELLSVAAPIVLLQLKEHTNTKLALSEIAPGLSKIGIMLPYTPLYQLLLKQFAKPIVATSGNISNAPIVYSDDIAVKELNTMADYILVHDREIIAPQDDSVVKYSSYEQKKIMLRRARGFAPLYINKNLSLTETTVLATGALLKSSFTLLHQQNIHISQYLGNTDNYDAQINFDQTFHHYLNLLHARPQVILIDKHPGYFTSQLGEQLAMQWGSKLITVQHHEAHFASVLGEYNLMHETEPVLGVIWDGTGFGNDGHIWGGEFFISYEHAFSRINHFDYFDYFLGDKYLFFNPNFYRQNGQIIEKSLQRPS
jgi:hydrogenase maturation protein HypF